jgi:PAS domain S-box-containing protein
MSQEGRILIVDDDEGTRRALSRDLSRAGHSCEMAADGMEGLEKLRANDFDIALVDLAMPRMGGIEMLRAMWQEGIETVSIVLSGNTQTSSAVAATRLGAFDYIEKPAPTQAIKRAIQRALKHGQLAHHARTMTDLAQEWEATFNAVFEPISIQSKDFRIIRANRSYAETFGIQPEELVGRFCYEVVHDAHEPCPACPCRRMLDQKDGVTEVIWEPHLQRHLEVSVSPLLDATGTIIGCVHVARDITQRKRAEEEIRELNERLEQRVIERTEALRIAEESFQAIVAKSADGILITSQEGVVEYVNPIAERLLHRATGELLGSTLGFPLATNGVTRVDIIRNGGEAGLAEMRVSETRWNGRPAYITSLRDITERTRAKEALRRAKEAAEAADRAKSEFLANMSHELRTPLNAIIGFSEGLLDRVDRHPLNDHQKDRLEKVLQSGRHLLTLINGVLDIAKIEAGKVEANITTFDVQPLAEEVTGLAEALIRDKTDLTFSLETEDDLPPMMSDRDKIKQILLNLIGNAAKFTPRGAVSLRIRREHEYIRMSVEDTGVGIPADQLPRIFEKFEQVKQSVHPTRAGTGLGLAIAKSLAGLLGGGLTAESTEGRGSTFTLSVPVTFERSGLKEAEERIKQAHHA